MITTHDLTVAIGEEDLRRFADYDALQALSELIWNSFDADARNVWIRTEYSDGAKLHLSKIEVRDDGRGFEVSPTEAFGSFGESVKKSRQTTPGSRIQHGREGKGRYRSLGLGLTVAWESLGKRPNGLSVRTRLALRSESPNRLSSTEEEINGTTQTGVTVTITDPTIRANCLFNDDLMLRLAHVFAPRLLADTNFKIFVNSEQVEVETLIAARQDQKIISSFDGRDYEVDITVCAWKMSPKDHDDYNHIFLCSDSGFAVKRARGHVFTRGITYSAFVKSSYFNDVPDMIMPQGTSEQSSLDPVETVCTKEARRLVQKLNRELVAASAASVVEDLKKEDMYPFSGTPKDEIEQAEREVFEVLAQELVQLSPTIRDKAPDKKKALMRALRAAVSANDESLEIILTHVLELEPADREEFRSVLERSELPKLIHFAKEIVNRLDFLSSLDEILFEPTVRERILERKHLHRILANHAWLFGEEYTLGADDVSLRKVLRRHREHLGLSEAVFDPKDDLSHLKDIPDLVFFKRIPVRDGEFESLVVELKAPGTTLREEEFDQIQKYARAVGSDPQFVGKWTFVIVAKGYDETLYNSVAVQRHRPRGIIVDNDNQTVWVKAWHEIIRDARARHEWLSRQLNLQVADHHGMLYLQTNHAADLPQELGGTSPASRRKKAN